MGGVIATDPANRPEQMQPTLAERDIEKILPYGEVKFVNEGEVLFDVGSQNTNFIVVLSGRLRIETDRCEGVHTIVEHRRGNF